MGKIPKFIVSPLGKRSLILTLLLMAAIAPISSHAHEGEPHTEKKAIPSEMSDEAMDESHDAMAVDGMGEEPEPVKSNIPENQDPNIDQAVATQSSGELPTGLGESLFSLLFITPIGLYLYQARS